MKKKDENKNDPDKPSDEGLWHLFKKTIKPLHKDETVVKKPKKNPVPIHVDERVPRGAPSVGKRENPLVSADIAADLNHRDLQRLKSGQYPIDGTLDLHGLTVDRAYTKCKTFVFEAYRRGHRKILVITGKGSIGKGLLRESLPQWLNTPDLRPFVLAFLQAKHFHGGEGAYYVLIKRNKEKG